MKESTFQANLIKKLNNMFPGCYILKNDANYIQGFPDLLILYRNHWAVLECKANAKAAFQPNQEFYISQLGQLSYAAVIYPENEEEVLCGLQQALRTEG